LTSNDKDHELRNLPALRNVKERLHDWLQRRSERPPPGSIGRGAKEPDLDSRSPGQVASDDASLRDENEADQ
jgi:hypothetical protein